MAAAAAEAVTPLVGVAAVHHVLNMCGFMVQTNRNTVIAEGFNQLLTFGRMSTRTFRICLQRCPSFLLIKVDFSLGKSLLGTLKLWPFG